MALTVTLTGTSVTLDETAGLQNSTATPNVPGDANDDDVAVSTLPPVFSDRLTTLGFNPNTALGAAESNGNVISINAQKQFVGTYQWNARTGSLSVLDGAGHRVCN